SLSSASESMTRVCTATENFVSTPSPNFVFALDTNTRLVDGAPTPNPPTHDVPHLPHTKERRTPTPLPLGRKAEGGVRTENESLATQHLSNIVQHAHIFDGGGHGVLLAVCNLAHGLAQDLAGAGLGQAVHNLDVL